MDNVNEVFKNILLEQFFEVKQPATIKRYVVEVDEVDGYEVSQALEKAGMRGKVSTAPEKGYNGWANFETWLLYTWLTNDAGAYFELQEKAELLNTYDLGNYIKSYMEQCADQFIGKNDSGFFVDVINNALREVDYYRIAQSFNGQ